VPWTTTTTKKRLSTTKNVKNRFIERLSRRFFSVKKPVDEQL
jgi:hypothetical protein